MVTGWPNMSNPADSTFFFILGISIAFLVLNTVVMVSFVVRYSRRRHPVPEEVKDSLSLEIVWTVVPTILVLAMFFVGWKGFQYMRTAPPDAMVVKVVARQWSWLFTYENGKQDSVLRVPAGKPVKLALTSADVLHSLYIPAYRIKEDCVPGMETHLWFFPDEIGSYDLFCTEYCGVEHSAMITKVEVMPEKAFAEWNRGAIGPEAGRRMSTAGTPDAGKRAEPDGAALIKIKGCIACHSLDGSPKIGPTFKNVFNKKEVVIREGKEREIVVDEAFIKQTLLQPELDRVKGYPPVMPSQKGVLTDNEIHEIIEFLRTVR